MEEWPRWNGETAVVVGTGPGACAEPLDVVRGRARVIAIKSTWRLAPWADALYGCDRSWWLANNGAPEFKGLKFSPSPAACSAYREIRIVSLKTRAEILTEKVGTIGCGLKSGGGHSGFQAVNLAVQFGAARILLVGFDMTLANGAHWTDDYAGVAKPDALRTESWRVAFDACAPQFKRLGVDVVNCTMASALTAYRKQPLSEAIGRLAA